MIKELKVTKGTVIRTILTAIVLVNVVLKAVGMNQINTDDGSLASGIECLVNLGVIAIGFWKNNSFSNEAKNADFYLQKLHNFDTDDADEVFEESGEDIEEEE